MNTTNSNYARILAITPSTRGFGFAVIEGRDTLVDWGGKVATGSKNRKSLAKVEGLIVQYQPRVLVLEDTSAKGSRRAPRIRDLSTNIIALAARHRVTVKLFSRKTINKVFFADGKGTKHAIAKIVGERFSEEIGGRVPAKRRPWESEVRRMDFFDAVALALAYRLRKANRVAYRIPSSP
jgi:Holliday junction resolvasome RuvABC endonuclease subunit